MVPGFNHNVKYKGQVFHVQTEDSGVENPHIITHLFLGGNIVKSRKSSYDSLLNEPDLIEKVKQIMQAQHKQMLRSLVSGAFDDKIVERAKGASMLNGPAPLNVERGQGKSSSMMSILEGAGTDEMAIKAPAAAASEPPVAAQKPPAPAAEATHKPPRVNRFPSAAAFLAEQAEEAQEAARETAEAPNQAPSMPIMPVMPPPSTVPPISALGPIHRAPTSTVSGLAAAAASMSALQSTPSYRRERITTDVGRNVQVVRPQPVPPPSPPAEATSIFDLPPVENYDSSSMANHQPAAGEPILDGDSLNDVYQNDPDAIDNIFGSASDSSLDDVLLGYLLSVEQN